MSGVRPTVTCRCGKEWFPHLKAADPVELQEAWVRLCAASLCRTCEDDAHRDRDSCPETVPLDRGVAACGGTYRHEGRCFPIITLDEIREAISAGGGA